MKPTVIIFLLCIVKISKCGPNIPHIPCPTVFKYNYDGRTWSGLITLQSPSPSDNILYINASFSIPGSIPLNIDGTLPASVNLNLEDYDETIKKIQTGQPLRFKANFPRSKYLPQVTNIKYNGIDYCFGPAVEAPSAWFALSYQYKWSGISSYQPNHPPPSLNTIPPSPTWHQPQVTEPPAPPAQQVFTRPPVATPSKVKLPVPSIFNKFRNDRYCGIIRPKRSLEDLDRRIINGTLIPENAHPWLAALYDNGVFFCAGSLISSKHVLTAAHCTVQKRHITIEVKLGAHNLNNLFDRGTQNIMATTVMEHHEYEGKAHGDIALLILNSDVAFTNAVRPICLWNHDSSFQLIVHYPGKIMGWGRTETGQPSTLPLMTDVTIAPKEDCRRITILQSYVTDETFCAGAKNTGPCMGDSGGGLFISFDNKWYLRGIISTALSYKDSDTCDTNSYAVYVDIAKYMDWIVKNM